MARTCSSSDIKTLVTTRPVMLGLLVLSLFRPTTSAFRPIREVQLPPKPKPTPGHARSNRVLVAMTDNRNLDLTAFQTRDASLLNREVFMLDDGRQARCNEGGVSYWTNNFLKTAQASIQSGFDVKYVRCVDRRADDMRDKYPIQSHWCKVMAIQRILTEGVYDEFVVIDSDAHVRSFQPGFLEKVFDLLATDKQFMVPDVDTKSFRKASLANASIITDIAHSCGFAEGGKHCTAVLLVRNNEAAKAIVQDWLARYKDNTVLPFTDQRAFNMLVPTYGSGKGMEVLASDLVNDRPAKDGRSRACFQHFKSNTQLLKESLATPEVSVFVHRQKRCASMATVTDSIGADRLRFILERSSDMVQEVEIGHDLQRCIEKDECR